MAVGALKRAQSEPGGFFQPGEIAGMRNLFNWMVWLLVSIIPLLSMGLLAQEWSTGTIESLMTAPVGETDVVLGKFLGSFAFFLVMLAPTLLYAWHCRHHVAHITELRKRMGW